MYEELWGKTILIMDRTALGACAVRRARDLGIRTVVANFYSYNESPAKQEADIAIDVDISNIDAVFDLIKKYNVDGVFIGWTDSHLQYYAEICKKAGLPCCGTVEQFKTFSTDKRLFKQACIRNRVPTTETFILNHLFLRDDLEKIRYPVVIKPANGSGGRDVIRCGNEAELIDKYKVLFQKYNDDIICEEFVDSSTEIFLNYTIQDSTPSLSASYVKHRAKSELQSVASGLLHIYSSSNVSEYRENIEQSVFAMFKQYGLRNCVISLQGFVKDGNYIFHEAGLRMGGGQSYVFTEALNGISSLDMMIEYALTGAMKSSDVLKQDNCFFSNYCANYYIRLKPGKIASISGIEAVMEMEEVLQCLSFHKVGDIIADGTSVDRIIYRIHVMGKTKQQLARALCQISDTLRILSTIGEEMQVEHLNYERTLQLISDS